MSEKQSRLSEQVRAFAKSIDVIALLVVTMDNKGSESWYFGQPRHAKFLGRNGIVCSYWAYAKSARVEAEACEKQAAGIAGKDAASIRVKRALEHEAVRLRREAEDHNNQAEQLDRECREFADRKGEK